MDSFRHKGYLIVTKNNSSFIYDESGKMVGCCAGDDKRVPNAIPSYEKAKTRIENKELKNYDLPQM